jgi:broad specificity phosphatase PhoE
MSPLRLRESRDGHGTKRVTFLRHGESLHKVVAEQSGRVCHCDDADPATRTTVGCPYRDERLIDAPLTERGHALVRGIGASLDVQVVLASTSVRTIETAIDAFPGVPIVALESLRSRVSGHMHTRRRSLRELAAMFANVEFPDGDEDTLWNGETESRASMDVRMQAFLRTLSARREAHVAVVTHFTVFLALGARNSETLIIGTNPGRGDEPLLALRGSSSWAAGELRTIHVK